MQPADVLDRRFEIVGKAGEGAMGVVYRAKDLEQGLDARSRS